jgi:hypothetical protein
LPSISNALVPRSIQKFSTEPRLDASARHRSLASRKETTPIASRAPVLDRRRMTDLLVIDDVSRFSA